MHPKIHIFKAACWQNVQAKLHAGRGGLGKARSDVSICMLTHPAAGVAQFPTEALAIRSSDVSQSAFLDVASQSLSINQWQAPTVCVACVYTRGAHPCPLPLFPAWHKPLSLSSSFTSSL